MGEQHRVNVVVDQHVQSSGGMTAVQGGGGEQIINVVGSMMVFKEVCLEGEITSKDA